MRCQLLHPVRSSSAAHLLHVLLIICCAFVAYYPALDAGLVFDDQVAIVKNADLRPESSLLNLFTNDYWGTRLSSHLSHKSYRPLSVLTFRLNYLLHKLEPFGYHLVNVVLHAIVSALVYRLALRVLHSTTSSLLAATIFALHPVHSDAVISIVGRAELLSAIFYLAGLLLVTGDRLRVDCGNKWRLAGCIVLGSLGLLCKEQCLMLLPLLVAFVLVDNLELLLCSSELAVTRKCSSRPSKSSRSSSRSSSGSPFFRPSSQLSSKPSSWQTLQLVIEILVSSLFPSFARKHSTKSGRHCNSSNQNKLNQLDKRLHKSNKVIWTLVGCFTIVLFCRLAANGALGTTLSTTLSAPFGSLDQIESMLHEPPAMERFKDTRSSNVTTGHQPTSDEARKTKTSRKFNSLSAFLTSAYVIAYNFWLLFYPDRLSCDWSFGSLAPVSHLADARNLFSLGLLVGLVVPLLKCLNFNHKSGVYLKLFLCMLVPFAPVLLLRTGFILAERTLYLPSIGFCLLIALAYEQHFEHTETRLQTGRKMLALLGICLMLNAMAIKCQVRSSDWKTERSLLTATLRVHPRNVKMLVNMAKLLANDGQLDEAIVHYDRALSIHGGYLRAYALLAELHYQQNRTDLALSLLFKAKDQVILQMQVNGQQIAQESMRILIRLEQLLQHHGGKSIQDDIIRLYEHLSDPASFLSAEESYNLAIILRNNHKLSDSIALLSRSKIRHTPSLELYNELLKPQQAVNHFRSAMELLRKHETSRPVSQAADKKIRYHLERSIFYDPTLVQPHYNLALLDYRQNRLQSTTRHHLQRVLQLQPDHFKAQLMLCDLALELQNEISNRDLFEAVHCYTKLLDSQRDLRETDRGDLSESKSSKSNESTEESKELKSKVMSLAHHNLCSVLDLINSQPMTSNATMNVSAYCSGTNLPSESFVQPIHFQVPAIRST